MVEGNREIHDHPQVADRPFQAKCDLTAYCFCYCSFIFFVYFFLSLLINLFISPEGQLVTAKHTAPEEKDIGTESVCSQ